MRVESITVAAVSDQPANWALIEAASSGADAVTQKQLVAKLDSLKFSFDNNLNKVVQSMKSSNENFDAKINTLNQHVASVKSEISAVKSDLGDLKALMEEDRKQKMLKAAFELVHLGSFTYIDDGYEEESYYLAQQAIEWFILGRGFTMPTKATLTYSGNGHEYQDFLEKFKVYIGALIQHEPRLVENNGVYTIYYN